MTEERFVDGQSYGIPCPTPSCHTVVAFVYRQGVIRVTCPKCNAVVYTGLSTDHRLMAHATAMGKTVSNVQPTKPNTTTDATIAPPITLTNDERERARKLLDW